MTNAAHKYEELMKNDHELRISKLEMVMDNINSSLQDIKQDLRANNKDMNERMNVMSQDMKSNFKDINNRLWTNFFWMLGCFSTILGLIAHTFRWI